jgi:hypothetical protein
MDGFPAVHEPEYEDIASESSPKNPKKKA